MSKCNNCGKCYICMVNIFKNKYEDDTIDMIYEQNEHDTPDLNDLDWSKESAILPDNIFSDNDETQTVVLSPEHLQTDNSNVLVSQSDLNAQFLEEENHYHIFHQPQLDQPLNIPESSTSEQQVEEADVASSYLIGSTTETRTVSFNAAPIESNFNTNTTAIISLIKSAQNNRQQEQQGQKPFSDRSTSRSVVVQNGNLIHFRQLLPVESTTSLRDYPEPVYPPLTEPHETCIYCNMKGDGCRRHIYGMYCCGLVYRYYSRNKDKYLVQEAQKLFVHGYSYVSEYAFYLRSDKQSIKAKPTTQIPKCLEYSDMFYILNIIEHEIFRHNQKKERSES